MTEIKQSKNICLTLDLEPDHAGYAPESYGAWDERKIKTLLALLKEHRTVLSIFVVTKTLKKRKNIVKLFQNFGCEFHLHTHTHTISKSSSPSEIIKGKKQFIEFFNKPPVGFRAPGGFITEKDLKLLKKEGSAFDSSVIPSFWPKASYFFRPNEPFKDKNGILEIPFSTISPLRFVVSLSWIRLFGLNFYKFLFENFTLPNPIIFSFHLHDLWRVPAYEKLPLNWKLKYARNKENGVNALENILNYFENQGYKYQTLGQIARLYAHLT